MADFSHYRLEYSKAGLHESELHSDPIEQFKLWINQALLEKLPEPYAMTLATVSPSGQPSARIVLLRGIHDGCFQFFTNYESRKGEEIAQNQKAALLFYWADMERQVRIEGLITKTSAETSDRYFAQRPRGSQMAAVISAQSKVIADRRLLEEKFAQLEKELDGKTVPRPATWGGYQLEPENIEFWQGRP
ncbi:MAG TPA: pyridoxamine 5'-phosphate oxidase, partial [Gemmatales bacterium]|nr:pyridoxamine 5'-phosphate oxidase [Gemmatales bacterium]